MDNIYDTLAKLNKVANAPEIVKEDSNALMKKGLEDLMKKTKFNKKADYKPFGKGDKDYETGLPKDAKKDKMFSEAEASWPKSYDDEDAPQVGDTVMHDKHGLVKVVKISDYSMMGEPAEYIVQTKSGKKKISYDRLVMGESVNEAELVEKESDVKRDDRAEKAGREVAHDAKYDGMKHAGKDGKDVTKDIEYDEKHDKDGMHENAGTLKDAARQGVLARLAELAGIPAQEIEEALGTPQDVAAKIMAENPLEEDTQDMVDRMNATDRDSVTIDMVKPAILKMYASYTADAKEWNDRYAELEKEVRATGVTDPRQIEVDVLNMDDDIISYTNIDDLEDKIDAIKRLMKKGDADGQDIVDLADSGPSDSIAREEFMRELKTAIKQDHPDVYSKLFMYGIGESVSEAEVEEGNEFSGERDKAIKAGKNDFTVDGKTYPVKGDKNESLEESDIDQIADVGKVYSKINKMKMDLVDDGMEPEDAQDKACEKYDCDPAMYDKYVEMKRDDRETKKVSEGGGRDMECGHCDGTGKHGDKDCKKCEGTGEAQDDDDPMNNESKVEETTSSGSVATGDGAGKPLFKNASVYESNEIVKRAKQLNEDMSISVNAGTNAEPSININASGEEAAKLAQLLKLAGMGMAQPGYGEVQVDVAEDQEFANGADDTNTMDTEYMTQDIAGGLNGPKKMAYPKVAGGDNPMSVLGESELNEVSEDHLMKLYQEYKAK
jgi:hypothetical protein